MGLRPVGLVQGFFCGQIAGWASYTSTATHNYPCVCMEMAYHSPGWVGRVDAIDQSWMNAHDVALERMLKEAEVLGAHGVVGVTTEMGQPMHQSSCEMHLYGTAVVVEGARAPGQLWSTQLAGHKLAKLIETGYVPASVAYARCTAVMAEGCYMEYYGTGRAGTGYEIQPLKDAHEVARNGTIEAVRRYPGNASLYGVHMEVHEAEGRGCTYITGALLGSLVRLVQPALPITRPVPTLNLGS